MMALSPCEALFDVPQPAPPQIPVVHVVAAALVDADGRVLVAQRPEGKHMAGLWEFPGGKVDPGELPEYALIRELEEELGIETRTGCLTPGGFVSHSYETFHIVMPLFICRNWLGDVEAREHAALKWVRPQELFQLDMPKADRPLLYQLAALL